MADIAYFSAYFFLFRSFSYGLTAYTWAYTWLLTMP